jgi:hypothetical protein
MDELVFWIITIAVSLFVLFLLNSIASNTRETRRYTQMITFLQKKQLEKQGETVDLVELYKKVKQQKG